MRDWNSKILLFILGSAVLAVLISVLLPEMLERWIHYNHQMLKRVLSRVLPFFAAQVGTALVVFIVEATYVGWKQSSLYMLLHPDRSMISDICIFLIGALQIDYVLVFLVTLGITHKIKAGVKTAIGLDEGLLASHVHSPVIQLFIYIVFADFIIYVLHFCHHKFSFLWPFHSYHHSATELNVLTAYRGHPVQSEFTNVLISVIPMTIVGFPLVSLLTYRILRRILGYMQHSRLPWKWGWIGNYLLASPYYHRVHHSVLPEHHDKNLTVLFPVWDHLCGTYYEGDAIPVEMGLPDNPYNRKSFLDDMLVPFRMFRKSMKG